PGGAQRPDRGRPPRRGSHRQALQARGQARLAAGGKPGVRPAQGRPGKPATDHRRPQRWCLPPLVGKELTMQYTQPLPDRYQPSLFYGLLMPLASGEAEPDTEHVSQLSLRGATGHCVNLLGSILRELSQAADARWLTLIAPPQPLTSGWLRGASLNRERILLLHARDREAALAL